MKKILLTSLILTVAGTQAFAATYDRYASIYRDEEGTSTAKKVATEFLAYPFDLIRWPTDKALVYTEKHHIDTKLRYGLDTLKNHGIHPEIGAWNSQGVDFDFVQLTNQKTRFPDLIAKGGVHWGHRELFRVDSEVGWQDFGGTGIGPVGFFSYDRRPEEDFYGIGPHASAGDGSSYKMETTTVGGRLDYDPDPTIHADTFFSYRNVNITNGEDGGKNIIDTQFPAGSIPGLAGDELLDMGLNLAQDSRNHRGVSTRGGLRRAGLSYHEGLGSSDARYLKYETELSQYFRLWSERRVLVLRFYGEYNDGINGGSVPFHQMAKLGGYGLSNADTSQTLRAFDENRFYDRGLGLFNFEYRYAIYEYRDFRMDSVLFWDEGQVFGEFSQLKLKDFRESYGLGLRLSVANHNIFSVEMAHGEEGTNFYVKTHTPF
ncbi:MAG TPA: BamA/TamA family outer membrane protein [Verrucomicrobiae bacterium]|nr:BamA/TamA family outer membrane protein [Verrucomicrobiae bacterium]